MATQTARAAYFDIDGTLTKTNIVMPLIWYHRRLDSGPGFFLFQLSLLLRGPYWLVLDRIDRSASNRSIYRSYGGFDREALRKLEESCYRECIRSRLMPPAQQKLEELKRDGVKIVLVTGGLDFVMQPLAKELGADFYSPQLVEANGRFTGELVDGALSGKGKADAVHAHAQKNNIDLKESFAFGDSYADLEMLECVGHPVAVNPDSTLRRIASQRGWQVEKWKLT
jgi:HAD superfamily hydrolase (TIGR01490 family)